MTCVGITRIKNLRLCKNENAHPTANNPALSMKSRISYQGRCSAKLDIERSATGAKEKKIAVRSLSCDLVERKRKKLVEYSWSARVSFIDMLSSLT